MIEETRSETKGTLTYGLDPVGNRQSLASTVTGINQQSASYNVNDQVLANTYDSNGNTLGANGKSYAYDSMDRMTSFNNGSVKMVYDGDGNRVAKTVGGVTTQYLVDELNPTGLPQVMDEVVKSGAAQRTYEYGLQRISQTQVASRTTNYYGYDAHGDVRYLMNNGGVVTDTYDYDAFGNIVGSTGTTPNVYRYQGEALDAETGLYYLRARYYDPVAGRFLSVDPMTDQGEHPYSYAAADPVNGHDPTGQDVEDALILAAFMPPMPQISGIKLSVKCLASMTLSVLSIPGQWMHAVTACQATPVGGANGRSGRSAPGVPFPSGPNKAQCNCTYHVRAHHLECRAYEWWGPVGQPFETFNVRSGNNNNSDYPKIKCVNNPACQDRPGVGPLPEGDYRMGSDVVQRGAVRIPLSFLDAQNYGRGGFQIHRDWPVPDRTVGTPYKPASEGCIATSDFGGLESFFASMSCTRGTVSVLP